MPKKKVVKTLEGYAYKNCFEEFEIRYGFLRTPTVCNTPNKELSRTVKVKVTLEEIKE